MAKRSREMSGGLQFTFGLISSGNKYLTAETFGFKIAASGNNLKKKQTWSLEQNSDGPDVYFKSHLGRYLAADKNGKVTCEDEAAGEDNKFQVEATQDGRWAIKSSKYGRYFGGSDDNLSCFQQTITNTYLWTVHLAMHPQVLIYNDRQKSYAHVHETEEMRMSKRTPWGVETLCTLVYQNKGYNIVTSNNLYLSNDGSLANGASAKTLFTIEFFSGKIAFKSKENHQYLAPFGSKGRLETRKTTAGKDEHFTLEDAHPQITLFSKTKQRFVSGKQGLQLSANQLEAEENETLQMEMDRDGDKVYFLNDKDKYVRANGQSIQADVSTKCPEAAFKVEWNGRHVKLVADNGKYVSIKPSGHLVATGNEGEEFILQLVNRPLLVLRGEHGFLGCKDTTVQGNKANYDIFTMESDSKGAYHLKAPNGKYITIDDDNKLTANGEQPQPFLIQLYSNSRMTLKPEDGDYITSDRVGIMTASSTQVNKSSLWEY